MNHFNNVFNGDVLCKWTALTSNADSIRFAHHSSDENLFV